MSNMRRLRVLIALVVFGLLAVLLPYMLWSGGRAELTGRDEKAVEPEHAVEVVYPEMTDTDTEAVRQPVSDSAPENADVAVIKVIGFEGYGAGMRAAAGAEVTMRAERSTDRQVSFALDEQGAATVEIPTSGPLHFRATFESATAGVTVTAEDVLLREEAVVRLRFFNTEAHVVVDLVWNSAPCRDPGNFSMVLREMPWTESVTNLLFSSWATGSFVQNGEDARYWRAEVTVDVPRPLFCAVVDTSGNVISTRGFDPPLRRGETRLLTFLLDGETLPVAMEFQLKGTEKLMRLDYTAFLFDAERTLLRTIPRGFEGGSLLLWLWPEHEYTLVFVGQGFAPVAFPVHVVSPGPASATSIVRMTLVPVSPSATIEVSREYLGLSNVGVLRATSEAWGLIWDVSETAKLSSGSVAVFSGGLGQMVDTIAVEGRILDVVLADGGYYRLPGDEEVEERADLGPLYSTELFMRFPEFGSMNVTVDVFQAKSLVASVVGFPTYGAAGQSFPVRLARGTFSVSVRALDGTEWKGSGEFSGAGKIEVPLNRERH